MSLNRIEPAICPDAQRLSVGQRSGPEVLTLLPHVSRETYARLETFVAILRAEPRNLVGSKDHADLWWRHIFDSAQLLPLILPMMTAQRQLLDLGSGGGFPGLILALCGLQPVILVECNPHKADFLRRVITQTGIDAEVDQRRITALPQPAQPPILTARALAPLPRLLPMIAPLMKGGGTALLHKGRSWEKELTECQSDWMMNLRCFASATGNGGVILYVDNLQRRGKSRAGTRKHRRPPPESQPRGSQSRGSQLRGPRSRGSQSRGPRSRG